MKNALSASLLCLLAFTQPAFACGTHAPELQRKLDAEQHEAMRTLAETAARDADAIFVATVTALERPSSDNAIPGRVTLAVNEVLKGEPAAVETMAWKNHFILSCEQSAMFANVGFRDGGSFVVYVQDGQIVRSAGADALRDGSLFKLDEERAIAKAQGGK